MHTHTRTSGGHHIAEVPVELMSNAFTDRAVNPGTSPKIGMLRKLLAEQRLPSSTVCLAHGFAHAIGGEKVPRLIVDAEALVWPKASAFAFSVLRIND